MSKRFLKTLSPLQLGGFLFHRVNGNRSPFKSVLLLVIALIFSYALQAQNTPVIIGGQAFAIPEYTISSNIGVINYSDGGDGDNITFSTTDPNFTVDPSGIISMPSNTFPAQNYTLTVTITDDELPPKSSTGTIGIIVMPSTPPSAIDQVFNIPSNVLVNNTVGYVFANPGTAPITSYSLISCSGNCIGGEFSLDPATGEIKVTDNSSFVVNNVYTLNVRVTDAYSYFDDAIITINIKSGSGGNDPGLFFTQVGSKTYGEPSFYLEARSYYGSAGAITYSLMSASSVASVDPFTGLVTILSAGSVSFMASQEADGNFAAGFDVISVTINQAPTDIYSFDQGNELAGGPFQLYYSAPPDFDGTLAFGVGSGGTSSSILSIDPFTGVITPLGLGVEVISISASGGTNYLSASPIYIRVTIYDQKIPPVANADTIRIKVGDIGKVKLDSNDFGYTGSLTTTIDLDPENPGIQTTYFKSSVGEFSVDQNGWLTYIPFKGFIGNGFIEYTIFDNDGLESNVSSVFVFVDSPGEKPQLKANEIMTPNDDGQNDALVIGYADFNNKSKFWILDETGIEVFYTENYKNDWSGIDKKKNQLTSGVYYYIYKEYDNDGNELRGYSNFCQILR